MSKHSEAAAVTTEAVGVDVVVAGHICLDLIPTFPEASGAAASRIEPGKLYQMGPAVFSTGGAVSNTGLALQRLGVPALLMGKVADDLFGGEVLRILGQRDPQLAAGMIVAAEGATSYSVVISPPQVDRSFLHCTGANDTFTPEDVDVTRLRAGQVFHFGYPPLMRQFYEHEGERMADLFRQVRAEGLITSLDMAMPDPASAAGQVNWRGWLRRVLPLVDLFLPSIEEILFMLGKPLPAANEAGERVFPVALLQEVAAELLGLGAQVVVLKLGEQGLYLQSGAISEEFAQRQRRWDAHGARQWSQQELMSPCFVVDVAGTTGSGDCTIAGFLAAFVAGASPAETLRTAVAVGACSVEAADSTTGVQSFSQTQSRIASGWERRTVLTPGDDWEWDAGAGVYRRNTSAVVTGSGMAAESC